MRNISAAAVTAVLALTLSGCGGAQIDSHGPTCLVVGNSQDLALKALENDKSTAAEMKTNYTDVAHAAEKCQLTFAPTQMREGVLAAAKKHPQRHFVLVGDTRGEDKTPANVKPMRIAVEQATYLAGYLAAATTTTGYVGTFVDKNTDQSKAAITGFAAGIDKYNQTKGSSVQLLGWDAGTGKATATGSTDAKIITQVTKELLAKKAAVIFPVMQGAAAGVAPAIKDAPDVFVIWAQPTAELPGKTITAIESNYARAVGAIAAQEKEGSFDSTPYVIKLEKGVELTSYGEFEKLLPPDLRAEVAELKKEIRVGNLDASGGTQQ
ncbi:MAG: BMP family ABC transporter substrate-binding protein [Actinomycetaceae bacterium]|nr:BMP family ABC transporter substrate-binding protein [Actinomycetaceae bacterium]